MQSGRSGYKRSVIEAPALVVEGKIVSYAKELKTEEGIKLIEKVRIMKEKSMDNSV